MNSDVLANDKRKIADNLKKLAAEIDMLDHSTSPVGLKNFNKAVAATVYKGERVIKEMRNFSALSMIPDTDIFGYDFIFSAEQLGISVADRENGLIEIIIPCLLPHREKGDNGFITVPLIRVLDKFVDGSPKFKKFEDCDICVTHIYDKAKTHMTHIRDHDNYELKKVMDVIGTFLLTSDSGRYCNTHIYTELSDASMTRIEIMPSEMFFSWIRGHKKYRKKISPK